MGRYQDSIAPLEKAAQLDPQPAVISNLGTSYSTFIATRKL
jgi:hypothetical protein